jgi:hypothetical protein
MQREKHRVGAGNMLRTAFAGFVVLLIVACARSNVQTVADYSGPRLPYPNRVLVYNFAVTPNEVTLDQGVSARLQQQTSDVPLSQQKLSTARQADEILTNAIVQQLRAYGLPAERAYETRPPRSGDVALVQGQIVSIDEGNRTRRTLVGLGAGQSRFGVDSQVYYSAGGAPPRFIEAFDADADSGRAPGMAETMGIGGAAGRLGGAAAMGGGLHVLSEKRNAGYADEAERVGKALAKRIAASFARQGWLDPHAIQ